MKESFVVKHYAKNFHIISHFNAKTLPAAELTNLQTLSFCLLQYSRVERNLAKVTLQLQTQYPVAFSIHDLKA